MRINGLTKFLDKLPQVVVRAIVESERQTLKQGIQVARDYSSGPHSQADLRAMDHPYAVRHGDAKLPPERINIQSGAFRRDWKSEGPVVQGDVIASRISNNNPVADYLDQGTKTMLRRPIADVIEAMIETGRPDIAQRAIGKALNQHRQTRNRRMDTIEAAIERAIKRAAR